MPEYTDVKPFYTFIEMAPVPIYNVKPRKPIVDLTEIEELRKKYPKSKMYRNYREPKKQSNIYMHNLTEE